MSERNSKDSVSPTGSAPLPKSLEDSLSEAVKATHRYRASHPVPPLSAARSDAMPSAKSEPGLKTLSGEPMSLATGLTWSGVAKSPEEALAMLKEAFG